IPIVAALALGAALAFASLVPAFEVREAAGSPFPRADVASDWRILYVGVLPTLVAVLPFQSYRRGPVLFFAVAGLAALVPPLFFPRAPICSLWVVALSIAGLAAVGWDGLARGRYPPRTVAILLAVLGALAVVAVGVIYWKTRNAGAVLVTSADLCFFDARTIRTWSPEHEIAPPWYAAHVGPERAGFRLYDLTTSDPTPAAFGFRLLNGYDYPRLACLKISAEALEDLNVRWLVSATAPPNRRWKEIARHGDQVLYET